MMIKTLFPKGKKKKSAGHSTMDQMSAAEFASNKVYASTAQQKLNN